MLRAGLKAGEPPMSKCSSVPPAKPNPWKEQWGVESVSDVGVTHRAAGLEVCGACELPLNWGSRPLCEVGTWSLADRSSPSLLKPAADWLVKLVSMILDRVKVCKRKERILPLILGWSKQQLDDLRHCATGGRLPRNVQHSSRKHLAKYWEDIWRKKMSKHQM